MQNMRGGRSCTRTEVALIQEAIDCDKNESISLDVYHPYTLDSKFESINKNSRPTMGKV